MNKIFSKLIAQATSISERQVTGTIGLLEEGCTIPFISRYRKEATGALNEVQVASISDQLEKLKELDEVAYVRFASVYRQFTDVNTFVKEIEKLLGNK